MGFGEAISTCFKKYATFSGRARRSEFWWFSLFVWLGFIVFNIIDSVIGTGFPAQTINGVEYPVNGGWLSAVWWLVTILPLLAVGARRLHDRDATAWWLLMYICCFIGPLILIFAFWIQAGTPGDNKYGPDPSLAGGSAG